MSNVFGPGFISGYKLSLDYQLFANNAPKRIRKQTTKCRWVW